MKACSELDWNETNITLPFFYILKSLSSKKDQRSEYCWKYFYYSLQNASFLRYAEGFPNFPSA